MNRFLILLTMLLTPLLALGQSTAVLDGIGLSNGKSYTNYIKNPNAQKNVANVTASSVTVARSTTTPLYNSSEFNLTSTGTPWSATWSTLALNEGLKNGNCEVSALIRGTVAGVAYLKVVQNSVDVFYQDISNVISATNPKPFGGLFPCGDLAYASTVVIGSSGATTGAMEVGNLYIGEPVNVNAIEYAYNTSGITTAGASDTTSFGYGPTGAAIGNIDSSTTSGSTTMRVRFTTSLKDNERVAVEIYDPAGGIWIEASQRGFGRIAQNTSRYGIGVFSVTGSTTDVDVLFGNAGPTSSGTTYGAVAAAAWSSFSTFKWRAVKKN